MLHQKLALTKFERCLLLNYDIEVNRTIVMLSTEKETHRCHATMRRGGSAVFGSAELEKWRKNSHVMRGRNS